MTYPLANQLEDLERRRLAQLYHRSNLAQGQLLASERLSKLQLRGA